MIQPNVNSKKHWSFENSTGGSAWKVHEDFDFEFHWVHIISLTQNSFLQDDLLLTQAHISKLERNEELVAIMSCVTVLWDNALRKKPAIRALAWWHATVRWSSDHFVSSAMNFWFKRQTYPPQSLQCGLWWPETQRPWCCLRDRENKIARLRLLGELNSIQNART